MWFSGSNGNRYRWRSLWSYFLSGYSMFPRLLYPMWFCYDPCQCLRPIRSGIIYPSTPLSFLFSMRPFRSFFFSIRFVWVIQLIWICCPFCLWKRNRALYPFPWSGTGGWSWENCPSTWCEVFFVGRIWFCRTSHRLLRPSKHGRGKKRISAGFSAFPIFIKILFGFSSGYAGRI